MENLLDLIVENLKENEKIPLKNGNFYTFLRKTGTKINKKNFQNAFEYQISSKNKKKVTLEFIAFMKEYHDKYNQFPDKSLMLENFSHETCNRPCNITVAKYIILKTKKII
jgi:hypothetical protein